jgi:hydroxymethylpyrimidine pyrophosphatase-like HAD family hydrolase
MRFGALATDYDGTIAHDGVVDRPTFEALGRARTAGLRLIMVTGRELPDLLGTFAHPEIFELIVAENGAVLYDPGTGATDILAPPPPPALLERLMRDRVPFSTGHSVIATAEPYEHQVLTAIRELGLEWHIIFNKGSVMVLPAEVTKATGLAAALGVLGISHEQTIGVGDAENDQALLRACGLAVAVGNALPSVKEMAHLVTSGPRGAGVAELIEKAIAGELDGLPEASSA